MSILAIIMVLIGIGVALYLVSLLPMNQQIYKAIVAVVLLATVLWVLSQFVDLGGLTIGKHRR